MVLNTKTIKRRIKSIGNTKKITKAMEMISAVKMRKAVNNVSATRNYSNLAWEMLLDISKRTNINLHPLLAKRKLKKIGLILITSNRGLAGGFSTKLLQEVDKYVKEEKAKNNVEVDIVLMGKRGRRIYKYYGYPVVAEFEKIDLTSHIEEILPMAQAVIEDYVKEKYDRLAVAYMHFASPVKQIAKIKQLFPFEAKIDVNDQNIDFKFEPGPKKVLDVLLPRLAEMQIYQAILESDASEHSARMLAMRNASDAAEDMIEELNFNFNKARQAAITKEISEIVAGAASLD